MTLHMTGRIAIAALTVVTALGLSACGEGDKPTTTAKSTTTSKVTAAPQGNYPPAPTVEELNAELTRVVDPAVPADQKTTFLQGVSADPNLPQLLTDFYQQNQATIKVINVTDLGNGTLTADAQAAIAGGAPNQATVPFVVEDGKWKVQKEWICSMLALGNVVSPACA
ncbi:hypothetical protein ACWIGI_21805 [Nocardia sp. NPDC055321]